MWMQVVRLRREGVRLRREQLGEPQPGCLSLEYAQIAGGGHVDHPEPERICWAHLRPHYGPQFPDVCAPLCRARVSRIGTRGMVIVGREYSQARPAREWHPQAWWCWWAPGSEPAQRLSFAVEAAAHAQPMPA